MFCGCGQKYKGTRGCCLCLVFSFHTHLLPILPFLTPHTGKGPACGLDKGKRTHGLGVPHARKREDDEEVRRRGRGREEQHLGGEATLDRPIASHQAKRKPPGLLVEWLLEAPRWEEPRMFGPRGWMSSKHAHKVTSP